jgi:hypothetical protein
LLVYDTINKVWTIEDNTKFKFAKYSGGLLHYVGSDNVLSTIYGTASETINWMYESGDLLGSTIDMKYVSKLKLVFHLPLYSEVQISMKYDQDPMWEKKGFLRSTKEKTYTFSLIPRRCSKYRLKLEGKGPMKLLGIVIEQQRGSDINGSIHTERRR